ncbi:MAG: hypothetical protein EBU90_08835 [Proteobacteria bacterium]|nr:hypothetical protein [Pseudomonadota bacterium]NBP13604.1 hypothetical protein [bacterium]
MTANQYWTHHTDYTVGEVVEYNNKLYKCLQNHNSLESYCPTSFNTILWTDLPHIIDHPCNPVPWFSGMYYYPKTIVIFAERSYVCLQTHIAYPYMSPAHSEQYWQLIV